jgi:hypothetical protein
MRSSEPDRGLFSDKSEHPDGNEERELPVAKGVQEAKAHHHRNQDVQLKHVKISTLLPFAFFWFEKFLCVFWRTVCLQCFNRIYSVSR